MTHNISPNRASQLLSLPERFRPLANRRLLVLAALLWIGWGAAAQAQTFSNTTSLQIPNIMLAQGPASLYPAPITVSGVGSSLTNLTVRFLNLSHVYPDDLDILLVGPGGQNVLLMSDTGGALPISNLTFTFDDAATGFLSDEGQLVSGTYKPTNIDAPFTVDSFAAPAPLEGPYGSTLSVFNGTNPNGVWRLYVLDDTAGNAGVMAGGWSLQVTAAIPEPSTWVLGCGGLAGLGWTLVRRRRVRLPA